MKKNAVILVSSILCVFLFLRDHYSDHSGLIVYATNPIADYSPMLPPFIDFTGERGVVKIRSGEGSPWTVRCIAIYGDEGLVEPNYSNPDCLKSVRKEKD